jgi:uncharacterized protein (DUF433 family)
MRALRDAFLTVPEAAFLARVSPRVVQHEIDERIVASRVTSGRRSISGVDILYLSAVRKVHDQMAPRLRRQVRNAIAHSAARNEQTATIDLFEVSLAALESEVLEGFETLERIKRDFIESRPEVLSGEPVLKGTRLSARLIADLVRQGASVDELVNDYDVTPEQVEAAVTFARVTPRRGRPPRAVSSSKA